RARSAVLIDVIDDEGACAAPLFLSDSLNLASSFNVGFTPALTLAVSLVNIFIGQIVTAGFVASIIQIQTTEWAREDILHVTSWKL
ncbi:hypothetical protein, partial [Paraburkholderia unamae]